MLLMTETGDIRWKQRLQNLEKSMDYMSQIVALPERDFVARAALVQFFEMTFELGWKLLKDYLEDQGYRELQSPRATIKLAFEIGLIENGQTWMEILADRNLTVHTYDEEKSRQIDGLIQEKYFPLFVELRKSFQEIRDES